MANLIRFLFIAGLATICATLPQFTSHLAAQGEPWNSEFGDMLQDDGDDDTPVYTFQGNFSAEQGTRNGTLNIVLDIKKGWHAYPQEEVEGQAPTKLIMKKSDQFKQVGPFTPNKKPKNRTNEFGMPALEFSGQVIWSAPIEFAANADPASLEITTDISGQICKTSCIPVDESVVARFTKYTTSVAKYSAEHITISGAIDKTSVQPGGKVNLTILANIVPDWHIYRREDTKTDDNGPIPTIISFRKSGGFKVSPPKPSQEPIQEKSKLADAADIFYHEDKIEWLIELQAPADAKNGRYELEGNIVFQVCSDERCDSPTALDFKFPIEVAETEVNETKAVAIAICNTSRDEIIKQSGEFWAGNLTDAKAAEISLANLALYLGMAFLAGLILNAMPCVLPVIGLKIMTFVQQAGEARGRILMLNLVFSLGLLTVFWILATLSAFFGFGWGDWLTKSMSGSIIITAVVFAFGLSMLGVWELPIPGMSGSSTLSKASEEEGPLGAFFLGILTTILATPCTGPMLIPAITFTSGQPPWICYLIFTTIGLGMALPYILVGFFPSLISWLPRPGAWMNTFKQITGFILMATVVFLMSSFSGEPRSEYLVAMLSLLLLISFGCWWIGRTSLAAETPDKLKAWGTALTIIGAGAYLSFTYLGPPPYELDWQQYSKAKLGELIAENRIVFIDFTGPN